MANIISNRSRWANMSEHPRILRDSRRSGWRGIQFEEIEVPEAGEFVASKHTELHLFQICGPIKVRNGAPRRPYVDLPPDPQLVLPGQIDEGGWLGRQRGHHLFVTSDQVERLTHHSFRSGDFRPPRGPHQALQSLLHALWLDVRNGHPCGPLLGETLVTAALDILRPGTGGFGEADECRFASREIARLQDLIDANLDAVLSLETLADELNVSVRHLTRVFRQSTGYTPHQYIMRRRIERAGALIDAGRLNLEEIAAAVGFAHHAHFTAAFRKIMGITPSQFRHRRR